LFDEKNKNKNNSIVVEKDEDKNKEQEKNSIKNEIYECTNKIEENDNYVVNSIHELTTSLGRLLKTTSMFKIECSDLDTYKKFKEDPEYQKYKEFNDVNKTIIFNKYDHDYTKTEDRGELITKYEDYESTLKEAGHTCKLVSDKWFV